ncbi:MAG TPA: OsmC family protein [Flavitalea sp.]|nr:OsmC family protein [Flavitalea sp.]
MANVQHIPGKGDKQFLFDVDINWVSKQKGVLSSNDIPEKITVATPPLFGGEDKEWSPEHLFLGALSSCFMTTYLAFARNFDLNISEFKCSTIGQVELVEGRFQFTRINIFPKIYVSDQELQTTAKLALEKTQKYCLVSNSVTAEMIYHSEVLVIAQHDTAKNKDYAIL